MGALASLPALASVLLLAGGALGIVVSQDPGASSHKLASMAAGVALLVGLRRLRHRWLTKLVWATLAAALILCVVANVQVDRNSWKLDALNRPVYAAFAHLPRLNDLAFNQNAVAAFLVLAIPFAVALTLRARGWRCVVAGAVAALLLAELVLTESRAAMLSLALASALFGWYGRGRARLGWLAAPLGAALLLGSGLVSLPLHLSWLPTGGSSQERLAIWQSALTMIADAPLTGIGLGMFQRVYAGYMLPAFWNTQPHAHNLFLQMWVEAGLPGVVGLMLLVAAVIRALPRVDRANPLAVGAAVSSVAVLLHGQVDCYFAGDTRTFWVLFLPLAMLFATTSRRPGLQARPLLPTRFGLVGGAVTLGALLAAGLLPYGRAVVLTNLGTIQRLRSEPARAHRAFESALGLWSGDWMAQRGLGLLDMQAGGPAGAAGHFRAAIDDGAPGQLIHFEAGQALAEMGDETGAVSEWRLSDAAGYFVRLAAAAPDAGTKESLLSRSLTIRPDQADAYEALASLYASQDRPRDAERQLTAELLQPGVDSAARSRAELLAGLVAYWELREPSAAAQALETAATLEPENPSPPRALAAIDSVDAAKWLTQAEQIERHNVVANDLLGRDYEAVGQARLAEEEYARVARRDPIGDFDLGRLHLSEGRAAQAIQELSLAVRDIPNQVQFRLELARAYDAGGQPAAAEAQRAFAQAMDPSSM